MTDRNLTFVSLVVVSIACVGIGHACGQGHLAVSLRTEPTASSAPTSTATAAPAAPPCIHERCEERPKRLECTGPYMGANTCWRWEVIYEHHCTCDQWASPTNVDGGRP